MSMDVLDTVMVTFRNSFDCTEGIEILSLI